MQALLDWFVSFSVTISSLIDYLIGMIQDLVKMIWMLAMSAVELPLILSFLPGPIVTLCATFLTAAILYKVLGREG